MTNCLCSSVQGIGNYILTQFAWPFLSPHVDYWWSFDDNIKGLKEGIRDLKEKKDIIKDKKDEAQFASRTSDRVEKWLTRASEKLEEWERIVPDDEIPAWKIISRYSLGKRAKETAKEIAELQDDGNFKTTWTMEFDSRKDIENDIVDYLEKGAVGMIVICGMRGVGKTAMAKRICDRVEEEGLFEVLRVPVVENQNIQEIQSKIDKLLNPETPENTKRKIVILEDVWDSFKSEQLENLEKCIETNFRTCKFLLTSGVNNACNGINNKKVFQLKILHGDEPWRLFKDKAGNCVECSSLKDAPKEVEKECKGLPIALVNVGITLQNIESIETWNNALSQLRKSNPVDFPRIFTHVYKPLMSSYDSLRYDFVREEMLKKVQKLLLLCCLFPENVNISVEQLTWYSMGLGLFDGSNNIAGARNRTHTWVENLKNRFLLIDPEEGKKGLEVKMHDVIRDVAIYIGSVKMDGFLKSLTSIENSSDVNCNWMSVDISNEQMEVPVLSRFSNLRLLMLSSNDFSDISRISFEGMENLRVLSFQKISIPSSFQTLPPFKNLQTLCLFQSKVENISFIGKLTSLKILNCSGCQNIKELPADIGSLTGLRLLELSKCHQLQTIRPDIISSLSLLEELKIRLSFSKWGTTGNASLTELVGLRNLTCLEIEISDCTLSAQQIFLTQRLVTYTIFIDVSYFEVIGHKKVMNLKLPSAVAEWIQLLARDAEFLSLSGDGSNNISLAKMENLRYLKFSECSNLRHVSSLGVARTRLEQLEDLHIENCVAMEQVFCNDVTGNTYIEFSKLKKLGLRNLQNLADFCEGLENIIIKFPNLTEMSIKQLPKLNSLNPRDVSFSNLKSINISECHNLKSLFSARSCPSQLEVLDIMHCEAMEQVFWNQITDCNTDGCIEFPKLKELRLWNLPNLTAFCLGLENIIIKFPILTKMKVGRLTKLKNDHTSFHFGCNPKDLLQLEILYIEDCESMKQVFWNEIINNSTDGCIEFRKLKELRLENLPNLTAFCQGLENTIIKFPELTAMWISKLPKLNSIFPPNPETVENTCFHLFNNPKDLLQLEILHIEDCESMKQVFWNNIKDNSTDGCIEFPKLKQLRLENLPNFTAFCQGLENTNIKFPKLIHNWTNKFPKPNRIFPPNSKAE